MKRFYLCAIVIMISLWAMSGFTQAQSGRISGVFFVDTDGSGSFNGGDEELINARVELYHKNGQDYEIAAFTNTLSSGRYTFSDLNNAQDYYVKFIIPDDKTSGYEFMIATDDDIDDLGLSDIINSEGYVGPIKIQSNNNEHGDIDGGIKVKSASLGGLIWNDTQLNGMLDQGETGLPNVTVELHKYSDGSTAGSTTSGSGGNYSFTDINPGNYYLVFVVPAGYSISHLPYDADPAYPGTGRTNQFTLNSEQDITAANAGLYITPPSPGSISGLAWIDSDGDGKQKQGQDPDPTLLPGVGVELFDNSNVSKGTTATGADGKYTFSNVPAGNYYVKFTAPEGYEFTSKTGQVLNPNNSDADETTGKTADFDLAAGENIIDIDAGLKVKTPPPPQLGSIGDMVFEDKNNNGLKDSGESGLDGVQVELYMYIDGSAVWQKQMQTNGSGKYKFSDLVPGTYQLKFTSPDGYEFSQLVGVQDDDDNSDADKSNNGKTIDIALAAGQDRVNIDAGLFVTPTPPLATGVVSGYVWLDVNGNGTENGPEPGKDNVTVKLYVLNTSTNAYDLVNTAQTSGGGLYSFTGLVAGTYKVLFEAPSGYKFTKYLPSDVRGQGQSDADNSLSNYGWTVSFEVDPDKPNLARADYVDAGLIPSTGATGSIGDFVWKDVNGNGEQNGAEPGVSGVVVDLYWSNGTSFVLLDSKTTDADGNYLFSDLIAGTYKVHFNAPSDYKFTKRNGNLNSANNSDANPVTGSDYGYTVEFQLDPSDPSIDNITYVDAGLIPSTGATGSIGDYVWMDLNGNGEQNGPEGGVSGVVVDLYWFNGTSYVLLESTTTDANGNYLFSDLIAGSYYVHFNAPSGDKFTKMVGILNSANNSDADPSTGNTISFQLDPNDPSSDNILYVDAGLLPSEGGKIGDFVWYDCDKDGIQDHGEPGVSGVTVMLYSTNGSNTFIAQTVTDAHGKYVFSNLDPGSYRVRFILPEEMGFNAFTIMGAGSNDALDSDADPTTGWTGIITLAALSDRTDIDAGLLKKEEAKNACIGDFVWKDGDKDGIQDQGEPGIPNVMVELYKWGSDDVFMSAITNSMGKYLFENLEPGDYYIKFQLAEGFTFTKKDQGSDDSKDSDADILTGKTDKITLIGENNLTIDAGMYGSDCMPVSLGDFVWNDLNKNGIQNTNEYGIAKITVNLYKAGKTAIHRTTWTDKNGFYHFAGLLPGTYYVQFVLPKGYAFTLLNQGGNDALDSDADMATGMTASYNLASGEANNTIDAGMFEGQCLLASLGDLVWNDCNKNGILDPGEPGMEGVVVKLHACTADHSNPGSQCGYGNEIASTKTDKNGNYYFYNLMPGYYFAEIILPCRYTLTKPDQGKDDWKDSDFNPATRYSACISLAPGQVNLTVDAGLYPTPPATLGDLVWIDANKNGIQDSGEKGLCNVMVELYMCGLGTPAASVKTDNDGKFIFKNVIPNTSYSLKFYLPKGYAFSTIDQGNNDNTDSDVCPKTCGGMTKFYDVLPDEVNMSIDCGMYLATTTACNYVWKDNNNNGVKDEGEAGIQGITVELYSCQGSTLVKTAKTDETGLFTFADILLDSYFMKILIPDGYKMGKTSPEGSGEGLSTDFSTNGQSSCFEITEGTTSIGKPVALVLSTTGVARGSEIPTEFSLQQNYPNPFNPSTTIEFGVPAAGQYTLKVFNMLGQEVATLLNRDLPVGYHMVVFDASRMPSGMYIYRLSGNNTVMIKKMMLSK